MKNILEFLYKPWKKNRKDINQINFTNLFGLLFLVNIAILLLTDVFDPTIIFTVCLISIFLVTILSGILMTINYFINKNIKFFEMLKITILWYIFDVVLSIPFILYEANGAIILLRNILSYMFLITLLRKINDNKSFKSILIVFLFITLLFSAAVILNQYV